MRGTESAVAETVDIMNETETREATGTVGEEKGKRRVTFLRRCATLMREAKESGLTTLMHLLVSDPSEGRVLGTVSIAR